jgi:hypothetical protein
VSLTIARPRSLTAGLVLVGLLAFLSAGLGAGVRSTYGGRVAVDEPQYLLSALSLWEDHDLDISDELAERRYLAFHDADLPVQTATRPDGSQLSPHDPLLPVLLAVPMGLGGWLAARLTLAATAGLLAGLLLWVAVRRFAVPPGLAVPGVALATCTAPLTVYGQQIYPELPGALAALVAVAALTAPRPTPRGITVLALAVIALPWLSVKYAPVGATLVLVALIGLRHHRRAAAALTAALAAGGIVYLAVHKAVYGGITAYASGDAFQGSGEFGVVGFHPDYPGRSIRLLGLLIDRDFGLAAWQPAWLLLIPALVALLIRRPPHWPVLAVPLLAGWATATWIALTMQGFWWPGRQLVVVLPLAVLVVLVWLKNGPQRIALGLATLGVIYYGTLLVTGYFGQTRWVLAPDDLRLHWPAALLLPDDRDLGTADVIRYGAWVVITALIALCTARRCGRERAASRT